MGWGWGMLNSIFFNADSIERKIIEIGINIEGIISNRYTSAILCYIYLKICVINFEVRTYVQGYMKTIREQT